MTTIHARNIRPEHITRSKRPARLISFSNARDLDESKKKKIEESLTFKPFFFSFSDEKTRRNFENWSEIKISIHLVLYMYYCQKYMHHLFYKKKQNKKSNDRYLLCRCRLTFEYFRYYILLREPKIINSMILCKSTERFSYERNFPDELKKRIFL